MGDILFKKKKGPMIDNGPGSVAKQLFSAFEGEVRGALNEMIFI